MLAAEEELTQAELIRSRPNSRESSQVVAIHFYCDASSRNFPQLAVRLMLRFMAQCCCLHRKSGGKTKDRWGSGLLLHVGRDIFPRVADVIDIVANRSTAVHDRLTEI